MFSYQKTSTIQKNQSLVPPKVNTTYLQDNRSESPIQRKIRQNSSSGNVIQLAKAKKTEPKKKKVKKVKDIFDRPSFTTDSKKSAILFHNASNRYKFKINVNKPGLPSLNAAQPHRLPWKDIREIIKKHHNGGDDADYLRLIKFFQKSGNKRIRHIRRRLSHSRKVNDVNKIRIREELLKRAQNSQNSFEKARLAYESSKDDKSAKELLKQSNSHHANVPDYGPHQGVNNPVSDAIHLNLRKSRSRSRDPKTGITPRSPSPTSGRLLRGLVPSMSEKGIAYTTDGRIITTSGRAVDVSSLRPSVQKRVAKFKKTIISGYQEDAPFGSPYQKNG